MSFASEIDEEGKRMACTEDVSDDDNRSVDELKLANDRRTHNADGDSSLDRLSLPSVSMHSAPFLVLTVAHVRMGVKLPA